MLDVINSVGLSSSVLKMIERRHKNDLYLALGGMVGGSRHCVQHNLAAAVLSTALRSHFSITLTYQLLVEVCWCCASELARAALPYACKL